MKIMNKTLGKEYMGIERENFLRDNADSIEEKGYMRKFTPEEILEQKHQLSECDIELNDIEEEKKVITDQFKRRMKTLIVRKKELLKNIKQKAEFVKEECYKYIEDGMVHYFNSEGDLIESRQITAEEMQKNIFQEIRKTGTNN